MTEYDKELQSNSDEYDEAMKPPLDETREQPGNQEEEEEPEEE